MKNNGLPSSASPWRRRIRLALSFALLAGPLFAQESSKPALKLTSAAYDAEIRGADDHVDIKTMVARLKELGVSTYYWLIYHRPSDWDDLKSSLPEAAKADLQVWAYLVPPSASPPKTDRYSEPFRLDYRLWAEQIAKLSIEFTNLTAWVIDDFYENRSLFKPKYLRDMQARAGAVNPNLAFLPLMYFDQIDRTFVENYHDVIDGVVVAYPQDRDEIDQAWMMLNDLVKIDSGDLRFPAKTRSVSGDFAKASQTARVINPDRCIIHFHELDEYDGHTAGYHFKQMLVDDVVVWESDVAVGEPGWHQVDVDVTSQVQGKKEVTIAFRLIDKKGVGNFPVIWRMAACRGTGLELKAGLDKPESWHPVRQGAFEAGFGNAIKPGERRFHIPFVVMTAANEFEFRRRHGDPATPERIAEWLQMCLRAQQEGKCDAVVTFELNLRPNEPIFNLVRGLFRDRQAVDPSPKK
ncbi:MAG: hypothetical protein ACYDH3_00795 [Candidatus Aminicenantales bacterium]